MTNRRAPASGNSYTDPVYDQIEASLEKKYGLPAGGMRAIRTKGERSNADQVSPVGARTVYQIMPDTRDRFFKRYGVDAYSGKEGAAEVAALHLRDDMRRTGSWEGAVRGYIGGPDTSKHGATTAAYVSRVTGKGTGSVAFREAAGRGDYGAMRAEIGNGIEGMSVEDIMTLDPADLAGNNRSIGPVHKDKRDKKADRVAAMTGGEGILTGPKASDTPNLTRERADEAAAVTAEGERSSVSVMDRVEAAIEKNWIGAAVLRSVEAAHPEGDAGFHDYFVKNWKDITGFAENAREFAQLQEAISMDHLHAIQNKIQQDRVRQKVLDSNGTGWAYDLGATVADPVGWAAAFGAGKIVQGFGLASRVASEAAIGAMSNVAMTAALDAAGEYQDSSDYMLSGAAGLFMGAAVGAATRGRTSTSELALVQAEHSRTEAANAARETAAAERLGPQALPDEIKAEASRMEAQEIKDAATLSLSPIPTADRLLVSNAEEMLTNTKPARHAVEQRHGLDTSISDEAERHLVAEQVARAEAFEARNPINQDATKTVLSWGNMRSTGLTLLSSPSVVFRSAAQMLLENTTGAAGRRRTASMIRAVQERMFMREVAQYDQMFAAFRKSQGRHAAAELLDPKVRREFDRRVMAEVERRRDTPQGQHFDAHPAVNEAADMVERGFDRMRVAQQEVGVVGSARFGTTARGYITHRLDPRQVLRLAENKQAMRQVRNVLADQLSELNGYTVVRDGETITRNFDADFAKKLATKYLEIGLQKARGSYEVPFSLHTSEAADMVRDAMEALNIPKDDIEKLMGKFSRGGASHTKGRLQFKLDTDLGNGMKLQDLFVNDVMGLYRAYARRASGEVALAQYGVMGKKGLDMLLKAGQSTGARAEDIEAFSQIAAEFLNMPYGSRNHAFLDTVRTATAASRLGGMGFTQLGEFSNGLAAVGAGRVASAITSMPRLMKEVRTLANGGHVKNPILQSVDQLGGHLGLDEYQLTRMFDIKDNDVQLVGEESIGLLGRAVRGTAHLQAVLSGHRMITAVQTRGMAEQIVRKAVTYIKNGTDDVALADMGITPAIREAVKKDLDKIATFDRSGKLLELDLLKGTMSGHDLMALRDAIERGAGQIIQKTYIGETGKWAHDGLLKMLTQFRTFSLISVEKQWGRNVNNYGALKSFMYLMGTMSLVAPVHYARVQTKALGMEQSKREEYLDKNLNPVSLGRATLNYASASGLLGDVIDVGAGFASSAGVLDDDLAPFVGARGQTRGDLIGGVVAPGVGLVEDLWQGVHGDGRKLAKALPGSNLPYVAPLVTGLTAQ